MNTESPSTLRDHLPRVSLVAAVARNGVIGRDNDLVWRDPVDARHLRTMTMGSPVIMGRKTWDSLPERFRPLPGRRNLVVTRQPTWHARGAEAVGTIESALRFCQGSERVFVLGGSAVYAAALPWADRLELTEVDADFEGDVLFPPWDRDAFEAVQREAHVDAQGRSFSFVSYRRKDAPGL